MLERIGGTRAQVHRGVLHASGRVVVVKHVPAGEPSARAGLRREAAVLGRVRHPALLQLLDVHDGEAGTSLVLARHVGGDLAAHLRDHGPPAAAAVAALGARVARALAALHAAGVVHRDVRAANVLLDAGGRAVLADLDHALDPTAPPLALDAEVVGGRDHLDPRLLAGEPADETSDLHALAVTLWHAVAGTLPPDGRERSSGPGTRHRSVRVPAGVDPALLDVLQDVLDGHAGDARAVADRLADIAGDVPGVTRVVSSGPVGGLSAPALGRVRTLQVSGVAAGPAGAGAGGAAVRGVGRTGGDARDGLEVEADGVGDGLAVAWAADEGTERFGRPGVPVVERLRRRLPRWHVVAAFAGLALVPLVVVAQGSIGQDDSPSVDGRADAGPATPQADVTATPAAEDAAGTGAMSGRASGTPAPVVGGAATGAVAGDAPATHSSASPVPPPPACPGVVVPSGAVLADLDGGGCGVTLWHDADRGVLTVGDGSRWALGRPGDVLLVGDWDGDGRWSPGLHRPSTGEVLLFPSLGDEEISSAPAERWPTGGRAVVVASDGRHAVVVESGVG